MAVVGKGEWDVTAVAPRFMAGDLRPIPCEANPAEACRTVRVPAYLTGRIHLMNYGPQLRTVLADSWDIVHAWEEPYILAGAQIAGWTPPSAALVFATFQNIAKRYPPPFGWMERYAMRRAAGWVAFGRMVEAVHWDRAGYAGKPHRVIPVGVDAEAFRPDATARAAIRARLGWCSDGPPVVGYLGRFVPEKGVRLLTATLGQLRPAWRALLVGGGPLERELREWAANHGDRVRVITGVPHNAVPSYLNAMDVLAAPSQTTPTWKEQLGRMLIEAMACGVSVVGSDSGEIPFVIGDAGLVLPEADGRAWVEGLAALIDSPTRRAEFGKAGLARAHEAFAWPVIARRHLDFFDELLDSPPRTTR